MNSELFKIIKQYAQDHPERLETLTPEELEEMYFTGTEDEYLFDLQP